MSITKTVAIKNFLTAFAQPDLAELYHYGIEVQVNAAQDDGIQISGDFKGRQWRGFTDGETTWKSFRIPWKAATKAEYTDTELKWDLREHTESIGMTGWNWEKRVSKWVGFDFDSVISHNDGLTAKELQNVTNAATAIPWVTTRKSTSGNGLHLYVFVNDIRTSNHTEHAALARAIIGKMSATTGFDFNNHVDICGGNLWVYHRKMIGTDGLELIKQGDILYDIPPNWEDHIPVIKGRRKKILPRAVKEETLFEQLTGQYNHIKLDSEHQRLLDYLEEKGSSWWYDQDNNLLVCHSFDLKEAHTDLNLRGLYDTIATGKDRPDHNCLSGDTEILTSTGPRQIKDVAEEGHAELYVYTPEGYKWVDCKVQSFGKQTTIPITFGNNDTIRTTLDHEWLVYNDSAKKNIDINRKKKTFELRLVEKIPLAQLELSPIDYEGYAHGFVFGDGHEVYDKRHINPKLTTSVVLYKHDQDLLKLFSQYGNIGSRIVSNFGRIPEVRQLPWNWKCLPKNKTKGYALGFILGLISADGSLDKNFGHIRLGQNNKEHIIKIRELAIHAGLRCGKIHTQVCESVNRKITLSYRFSIKSYNLTKKHFLRLDHQQRFVNKNNQLTNVKYIDFDDKIEEEVFCAIVPKWHNFTLANGIITGNCFCKPAEHPSGSWVVRRFSQGIQETDTWFQDNTGFTCTNFNREPTLEIAARTHGAVEDEKGAYHFREAEVATTAVSAIGAHLNLPSWAANRKATIKKHKDGKRVIVSIKREPSDNPVEMIGWKEEKDWWKKIFDAKLPKDESLDNQNYDSIVRHLVTVEHQDSGWVLNANDNWQAEPLNHLRIALKSLGLNDFEINNALGKCVLESWKLVNKPFEPEYPGSREWNRDAVQLKYLPQQEEPFVHTNWDRLLNQCGHGLNDAVTRNGWCLANGIQTGADYLRLWIASLFQFPTKHLPYLFLYSLEQQTGKTTLHESLKLLLTSKGYMDVKAALISQAGFNEEIKNAIICAVDECDLRQNKYAYNRIKDWITGEDILIHPKGRTPYMVQNIAHFIHTGNNPNELPVFSGDSRIVVIKVPPIELEKMIPKDTFLKLLDKEAPAFLATLFHIDIPPCNDRLSIPVIETEEKELSAKSNRNAVEIFLDECCYYSPGDSVLYSDLWVQFNEWLDPGETIAWTKIKMGRTLPSIYPKGRLATDGGQFHIGNISFAKPEKIKSKKYILKSDNLALED